MLEYWGQEHPRVMATIPTSKLRVSWKWLTRTSPSRLMNSTWMPSSGTSKINPLSPCPHGTVDFSTAARSTRKLRTPTPWCLPR
jgi:hypothetical protein